MFPLIIHRCWIAVQKVTKTKYPGEAPFELTVICGQFGHSVVLLLLRNRTLDALGGKGCWWWSAGMRRHLVFCFPRHLLFCQIDWVVERA
jgi:hypothetical protein